MVMRKGGTLVNDIIWSGTKCL